MSGGVSVASVERTWGACTSCEADESEVRADRGAVSRVCASASVDSGKNKDRGNDVEQSFDQPPKFATTISCLLHCFTFLVGRGRDPSRADVCLGVSAPVIVLGGHSPGAPNPDFFAQGCHPGVC